MLGHSARDLHVQFLALPLLMTLFNPVRLVYRRESLLERLDVIPVQPFFFRKKNI